PHLVELVGPANKQQSGSACLVEGDEQGQFVPLGPECSFVFATAGSGGRRAGSNDQINVHPPIFWPNDRDPALVVVGRQNGRPLEINRIQVYELGEQLRPMEQEAKFAEPDAGALQVRQRLLGPYLRQNDLTRNFCGPRSTDPLLG